MSRNKWLMSLSKIAKVFNLRSSTSKMTQELFTKREMTPTESQRNITTLRSLSLKMEVLQLAWVLLLGEEESLLKLRMPLAVNSRNLDSSPQRSISDLNTMEVKDHHPTISITRQGSLQNFKDSIALQDLFMFHKVDNSMMPHHKVDNTNSPHNINSIRLSSNKSNTVLGSSTLGKNNNTAANTCAPKASPHHNTFHNNNQNTISTTEVSRCSQVRTMGRKKALMKEDQIQMQAILDLVIRITHPGLLSATIRGMSSIDRMKVNTRVHLVNSINYRTS